MPTSWRQQRVNLWRHINIANLFYDIVTIRVLVYLLTFNLLMKIEDLFEEWEDVDLEGIESFIIEENGADEVDEEEISEEISDNSSDCEDDDQVSFKCCKCKKVYHTRGWLKKT